MKIIKFTIGICFLLINSLAFAQTNVESLKKEIATLTQNLKSEQEKTAYLKDALDLRNKGVTVIKDSISIRVTEIKGNLSKKSIEVKGLITYKGNTNRTLQFAHQELVDPNGNIFDNFGAVKTNDLTKLFAVFNAEKDIAYGFIIIFKDINEKFPTASLLRLQNTGSFVGSTINLDFKGIDIIWE